MYLQVLLNFTKKAAPGPHHLLEDGLDKAGNGSLRALWSWACTSTPALLTAMQNPYTTCDKTQNFIITTSLSYPGTTKDNLFV